MKAIEILNKLNKAEHWEDYYPSKLQCNEAIAELEALENRDCTGCKYEKIEDCPECIYCKRNCLDCWEDVNETN